MSNSISAPISNLSPSLCPTNGRQTVGDGAFNIDATPKVLAVCHLQGEGNMYYYSTTFSGGPQAKCPPDGGSSECVTGIPASKPFSNNNNGSQSLVSPHFPIPTTQPKTRGPLKLDTRSIVFSSAAAPELGDPKAHLGAHAKLNSASRPPLVIPTKVETFSNGIAHCHPSAFPQEHLASVQKHAGKESPSDFILKLFPFDGPSITNFAKSVSISAPNMDASFEGAVLELPGKPRTFYVDGKGAEAVNLRESIVALLDLAHEQLVCSALVIALERSSPALGDLLHSLMYVGGVVVTKPPFKVDAAYVLVGLETS